MAANLVLEPPPLSYPPGRRHFFDFLTIRSLCLRFLRRRLFAVRSSLRACWMPIGPPPQVKVFGSDRYRMGRPALRHRLALPAVPAAVNMTPRPCHAPPPTTTPNGLPPRTRRRADRLPGRHARAVGAGRANRRRRPRAGPRRDRRRAAGVVGRQAPDPARPDRLPARQHRTPVRE